MSQNHHYSRRLLNHDIQYHTLFSEHQKLEAEIKNLRRHPATDSIEITYLKRRKLQIVDELERVRKVKLRHMN